MPRWLDASAIVAVFLAIVPGATGYLVGGRRRRADTLAVEVSTEGGFVNDVSSFVSELMASNREMQTELLRLRADLAAEVEARHQAELRVSELERQLAEQQTTIRRLSELTDRRRLGDDPRLGGNRSTDPT